MIQNIFSSMIKNENITYNFFATRSAQCEKFVYPSTVKTSILFKI
jgi:hypothetical protein